MNKFLKTLLFVALALFLSNTWGANKESTNGGKGSLKESQISQFGSDCFQVGSGTVKEVCAKYTINWKMWSLMAEPVGDYKLSWQLTSIKLMDPERKLVSSYSPDQIPSPLKKGVAAIALYIDGYAAAFPNEASSNSVPYHRFNTGVAVRANAGSSYNVPGSPSWDKLFIARGNACEDKTVQYLDAQSAKTLFSRGIKLTQLHICPTSDVSELTSLESAIGKLCEKPGADKKYQFCPIKIPEEMKTEESNSIDDAFSKMEKQTGRAPTAKKAEGIDGGFAEVEMYRTKKAMIAERLAIERTKLHTSAVNSCRSEMQKIDACFAKTSCKRPAETPSVERCNSIPLKPGGSYNNPLVLTMKYTYPPGHPCYDESSRECKAEQARNKEENRRKDEEEAERIRQKRAQWESQYGALNEECKQRKEERTEFAACQEKYGSECNPKGIANENACVDARTSSSVPTEQGVRAILQKEQPSMNFLKD